MLNVWLKLALAFRGIRQVELARELTMLLGRSVDASAIHKLLKGSRRMYADELLQISQLCRYPVPITFDGILADEAELRRRDDDYRKQQQPGPNSRDERRDGAPGRFVSAVVIRSEDLRRAFAYQLLQLGVDISSKQINEAADRFVEACDKIGLK